MLFQLDPGKISKIVFIGHGGADQIGLSGDTNGAFHVTFSDIEFTSERQEVFEQYVKPKLSKNAEIHLITCNLAVTKSFMQSMADFFGIPVRAYSESIRWCVSFTHSNKIYSRGLLAPQSEVDKVLMSGTQQKIDPPCNKPPWKKGLKGMVPPQVVYPT